MTSSQHVLDTLGDTHATMGRTMGCQAVRRSQSCKAALSSDRRLQLACVKSELLVTAGQLYRGEYVPGSCTHRPSRHLSLRHPKHAAQPLRGRECAKVWPVRGTKS